MCKGPKRPKPPEDPRANDPDYAKALGITDGSKLNSQQIYDAEKAINNQSVIDSKAAAAAQEKAFQDKLDAQAATAAATRAADIERENNRFNTIQAANARQFEASMAAQASALAANLAAQAELQRKSEEAALRAQVPQMTNNSRYANRVKSKASNKKAKKSAALGASQLRIPLGIGATSNTSSPVKLNIGS